MKIGIFLGYGPQARLSNEGLGRYIGGLIKGFSKANIPTTIVAPAWMRENLENFFREINIDSKSIQIVTTKKVPIVWKLYKWIAEGGARRHPALFSIARKHFGNSLIKFTKSSTKYGVIFIPFYVVVTIICLIAAIPASLILALYLLVKLAKKNTGKKRKNLKKDDLDEKEDALLFEIFYAMTSTVIEQLIEMINKNIDCDIWYVPSLFWPQVNSIKAPVVINAPDLVSAVYPAEFADVLGSRKSTKEVKETIEKGKYFITYCEHIRRTLLLRDYGKDPDKVIAIPHVNNSSKPYIDVDLKRAEELFSDRKYDLELCKKLLNKMNSRSCPRYYMERINLDNVRYMFYASQIRPHKNVITLLRAYEYILREKRMAVKLILTGDINPKSKLPASKYIYEHGLENDVLAFSGVSATTLSALYRCAELVVNPSMYEGGFAFTFGEGMSVGTPSLLANEPFEMDVLGPAGLEDATFDPTNWRELADKIEYWLPRREELYQKELPLYEELAKRTPDVVANEYIEAFRYFLDREKDSQDSAMR